VKWVNAITALVWHLFSLRSLENSSGAGHAAGQPAMMNAMVVIICHLLLVSVPGFRRDINSHVVHYLEVEREHPASSIR